LQYDDGIDGNEESAEDVGVKVDLQRSRWEYMDDKNKWIPYPKDQNDIINNAYLQQKKSVEIRLKFPATIFKVDFEKLMQINPQTKKARKIRKVVVE